MPGCPDCAILLRLLLHWSYSKNNNNKKLVTVTRLRLNGRTEHNCLATGHRHSLGHSLCFVLFWLCFLRFLFRFLWFLWGFVWLILGAHRASSWGPRHANKIQSQFQSPEPRTNWTEHITCCLLFLGGGHTCPSLFSLFTLRPREPIFLLPVASCPFPSHISLSLSLLDTVSHSLHFNQLFFYFSR